MNKIVSEGTGGKHLQDLVNKWKIMNLKELWIASKNISRHQYKQLALGFIFTTT